MEVEFKMRKGKVIEDKNWFLALQLILGEQRAIKWLGVEIVSIPLGRDDDG